MHASSVQSAAHALLTTLKVVFSVSVSSSFSHEAGILSLEPVPDVCALMALFILRLDTRSAEKQGASSGKGCRTYFLTATAPTTTQLLPESKQRLPVNIPAKGCDHYAAVCCCMLPPQLASLPARTVASLPLNEQAVGLPSP